jgi:hypothetical protein
MERSESTCDFLVVWFVPTRVHIPVKIGKKCMCGCKVQFCFPKVQFNQTMGVYSISKKGSV